MTESHTSCILNTEYSVASSNCASLFPYSEFKTSKCIIGLYLPFSINPYMFWQTLLMEYVKVLLDDKHEKVLPFRQLLTGSESVTFKG
jgi:hypothetical protein